ncbi:response regulator transcription factor [Pseudomaricurvus alkylphenolicus]|nr:response regulator transcription factor [Pseudomaricurvus alkylphenolicus]
MQLVSSMIPTTALSFYFLDPHMHLKGFVGINVDDTINSEYGAEYWKLDPLHPRNFADSEELLVCSNTTMPYKQWRQTIFYQDFMEPRGFSHSADIFFRNDESIIAALLTTRSKELGEYQPEELRLMRGAQRFIQFSLNRIYLPPRIAERQYVEERYGLTQRELDVLESAMAGHSNKIMCEDLKMRLPTLRTHLHHIFEKVGVSGTNELISRIFRELSDRDHRMEVE